MDEIATVKLFRSQIPERDPAAKDAARRAFETALGASRRRRRPLWRSRRALVVAAAALVGVVAASSAFGWTSRLVDLIAGEPAPPRVKRAFAVQNEARARQVMPIFRASGASDAIVAQTHGVIGIESSVGEVIVWAAPTKGGGLCWVLDIEALRRPDGLPNGGGGCSPHSQSPRAPLEGGIRRTRVGDRFLELVQGRVRADVASVELRYADGAAETLPVFERFFLHEPRPDSEPILLIARDREGAELQRQSVRSPESLRDRFPEVVGPERPLIRLETASGFPLTFALAPAEDDQLCQITRYRGSVSRSCGPDPRERVVGNEISIHPGLWNEAEDGKPLVTLNGVVGASIARLELHYDDGSVAPIPIREGFVLFEIPPSHREDAQFVLVGRDSAGEAIARHVVK
jgi:hypothetical protein